ncbi:hypothetical protein XocBAI20_12135 [Xanthomonas oryzae pv. oryzicola]|nr:hypothetical protein XocBAI20_12135 [Xanthomonas oryzae pv. oryzicola]
MALGSPVHFHRILICQINEINKPLYIFTRSRDGQHIIPGKVNSVSTQIIHLNPSDLDNIGRQMHSSSFPCHILFAEAHQFIFYRQQVSLIIIRLLFFAHNSAKETITCHRLSILNRPTVACNII